MTNNDGNHSDTGLQKFEHAFEGRALTTIIHKGRECWVARQAAEVMDYADPSNLTEKITTDWSDEFLAGMDFDVLTGPELKDFKTLMQLTGESPVSSDTTPGLRIDPRTPKLLLLYEGGMYLACMKSGTEPGKRLRRWLATEVLPAIRRTGAYAATGSTTGASPDARTLPSPESMSAARAMRREARRLEAQGMRLAAEHLRLSALEALVERAMPEVRAVLAAELAAAETAARAEGEVIGRAKEAAGGATPGATPRLTSRPGRPPTSSQMPWVPLAGRADGHTPVAPTPDARTPAPWGRRPGRPRKHQALEQGPPAAPSPAPEPTYVTHPEDRDATGLGTGADGLPTAEEWRALLEAWWATYNTRFIPVHQLVALATKRGILQGAIGDGGERSQRTRLGMMVARRADIVEEVFASAGGEAGAASHDGKRCGLLVRIERTPNRKVKIATYRLVRVVAA